MSAEKHVIDLRADFLTEEERAAGPHFQPADPMDVQHIREVITRKRIERMAEGYRKERERDGRPL